MSCGLYCGGDTRQAHHVGTRCLSEKRDAEQKEQVHAHRLLLPEPDSWVESLRTTTPLSTGAGSRPSGRLS
jgi:hypothetical protein